MGFADSGVTFRHRFSGKLAFESTHWRLWENWFVLVGSPIRRLFQHGEHLFVRFRADLLEALLNRLHVEVGR